MNQVRKEEFEIVLPSSGRGKRELELLYRRRKKQVEKALNKLRKNPTDYTVKGIEKINEHSLGEYTIRVSKGDRIYYDVDRKNKRVLLLRAGKHDLYRLL